MFNNFRQFLREHIPASLSLKVIQMLDGRGNTLSHLLYGPATYNQDGLLTAHNADFMQEPRFAAAYKAGKQTGSWPFGDIHWRVYILCWAANRAVSLPGDFVECGVNRGGFALTITKYVNFETLPKNFYLLDTFEGLVEKYISPEEHARGIRPGGYEECYSAVQKTFAPYPNIKIIKGVVPETLPLVEAEQISFLSIDMNTRDPEIAAAEFFWDKLVSGAIMIVDDYGWRKHYEQKIAFDEFARYRGVQVLPLPTGQGLIFKP